MGTVTAKYMRAFCALTTFKRVTGEASRSYSLNVSMINSITRSRVDGHGRHGTRGVVWDTISHPIVILRE